MRIQENVTPLDMECLGLAMRHTRRRARLTQAQAAEVLGVDQSVVSRAETSPTLVEMGLLERMVALYGATMESVLRVARSAQRASALPPTQEGVLVAALAEKTSVFVGFDMPLPLYRRFHALAQQLPHKSKASTLVDAVALLCSHEFRRCTGCKREYVIATTDTPGRCPVCGGVGLHMGEEDMLL